MGHLVQASFVALALLLQQNVSHGQNVCRQTNDGYCNEPSIGNGVCPAGTDGADCRNACPFAYDGECDEPRLCPPTTDTEDCASRPSASRRRRSTPTPAPSPNEDGYQEFEDEEQQVAGASGLGLVIGLSLLLALLFFPCIVFGCAWCICIQQRSVRGEKPGEQAWTVCASLFALTLITPFFGPLGLLWFILPFCMIIPFSMSDCYIENGRNPPSVNIAATVETVSPQTQVVQAQPVMAQAVPVQAQPVMAQAVPVHQSQTVTSAVVASVANPVAGAQQVQLSQVDPQELPRSQQEQEPATFEVQPSTFEVEVGDGCGVSLHDFLAECQLTGYEMAMQEMGVLEAADLRDITEEELVEMGMKNLEVRRLQRSLESLQTR